MYIKRSTVPNEARKSAKQKRREIKEYLEINRRVTSGESQESVGSHFGIKRQAIGHIIANKEQHEGIEVNQARKSLKFSEKYASVDELLYTWFVNKSLGLF